MCRVCEGVKWIECGYWCETCKQPLINERHATDHRDVVHRRGVRRLFKNVVRIRAGHVCVCAFRTTKDDVFKAHLADCDFAFEARIREVSRPVECGMSSLYESKVRECCACGSSSMVKNSRGNLVRNLLCKERSCRCEVSENEVGVVWKLLLYVCFGCFYI